MKTSEVISELVHAGVVLARSLPGSARTLSRLAADGRVVRLLPGVYTLAPNANHFETRCLALMLWDPDAVITGRAAARLTFWTEARVEQIEFHSTRKKSAPSGFRLHRSRVPVQDVAERNGIRVTRTARTSLSLARDDDGEAIDEAFRRTRTTLGQIASALGRSRGRWGNRVRRRVVAESRDQPWSQAERKLHRILREAGLSGWVTNHPVQLAGRGRHLDVAFLREHLVIEVDGRSAHGKNQFEDDRARQNELVRAGWAVLRLTWAMLSDPAAVVDLITDLLRQRRPRARTQAKLR